MMRKLDLIIFDLDGTLIDSRTDIAESVNVMLEQLDLPELSESEVVNFVGRGVRNLVQSSVAESIRKQNGTMESVQPPSLADALSLLRTAYAGRLLVHTRLYPGVLETLRHFARVKKAVCSNKPQEFSEEILRGLGVLEHFTRVVGGDSLPRQKPHPDPIVTLMSECGAMPDSTMMVGDSVTDIEAGKAAGVLTCAVTTGFRPRDELLAARPDFAIENLFELTGLLRSG